MARKRESLAVKYFVVKKGVMVTELLPSVLTDRGWKMKEDGRWGDRIFYFVVLQSVASKLL